MTRGWYDTKNKDIKSSILSTDTINMLLSKTPYLKVSQMEIEEYYKVNQSISDRTEFIKEVFNDGPTEIILEDGTLAGYEAYQNGLYMWEDSLTSQTAQEFLSWDIMALHYNAIHMIKRATSQKEEQFSFLEMQGNEKISRFSFTQEIIDYVLKDGGPYHGIRTMIHEYFQKGFSPEENINFLKKLYGTGGCSPIIIGTHISENHNGTGIELVDDYHKERILLKWPEIAKRISELIKMDCYSVENQKDVVTLEPYKLPEIQPKEVTGFPGPNKANESKRSR